jgi:hypothetical protein
VGVKNFGLSQPNERQLVVTVLLPTSEQVSQSVTVYKKDSPITMDGYSLNMIGFPTLKWPQLQSAGRMVEIQINDLSTDPTVTRFKATVKNCLLFLDSFDRVDGLPGNEWSGNSFSRLGYGYYIRNRQLDVNTGGPLYSQPTVFGADQEAWARITNLQAGGANVEQGLLLKVQPAVQGVTPDWRQGAIKVVYQTVFTSTQILVASYLPGRRDWSSVGTIAIVPLKSGDILQARVVGNEVYVIQSSTPLTANATEGPRDSKLLGRFRIDDFFTNKRGQTGLWFQNAPNAVIESFGAGDISMDEPCITGSCPSPGGDLS